MNSIYPPDATPLVPGQLLSLAWIEGRVPAGFPSPAADVAAAAKKYADEETALLVRQLIPKSAWSGVVVVRRHFVTPREETWLMLKYESGNGWNLDSALFV